MDLTEGKTSVQTPVFVIKYGPPASGKGSCLDKFNSEAEKIGDFTTSNFVDINVDDIVTKLDVDKTILADPNNYWNFRKDANQIADAAMAKSFQNKLNIMFETTGNNLDENWLMNDLINPAKKNNYKILVVYPLVPSDVLVERSAKRAESIGRSPEEEAIRTSARNASKNILKLIRVVDRVIIYDNRSLPACDYKIIECNDTVCSADMKWVVDKIIKENFGIDLSISDEEGPKKWYDIGEKNIKILIVFLIVVILVCIVIIVYLVYRGYNEKLLELLP